METNRQMEEVMSPGGGGRNGIEHIRLMRCGSLTLDQSGLVLMVVDNFNSVHVWTRVLGGEKTWWDGTEGR